MCTCAMRAMRCSSVFDILCVSALLNITYCCGLRLRWKHCKLLGTWRQVLNQTVCFVWPKNVFCQGPCQILMKGYEAPLPVVFFLQAMEGFGPAFDHQPCSEAGCKFFWAILRFVRGVGRMYQNAVSHMMRMGRESFILVVVWNLNS